MHSYKLLTFIGLAFYYLLVETYSKKSNFSIQINSETNIISNAETLSLVF